MMDLQSGLHRPKSTESLNGLRLNLASADERSDSQGTSALVTVPSAFGARNLFHSGLVEHLAGALDVVVAVPPDVRPLVEPASVSKVWDLPEYRRTRKHTVILESLRDAFFDRFGINSRDVLLKHRHRYKKKTIRSRLSEASYKCLSPLGRFSSCYRWLEETEQKLFRELISEELQGRLLDSNIRFGLSTVFVSPSEWLLARALQEVGIPTATHILSFDNLTSMGYRPLKKFDLFLAWSERMATELQDFYGVPREKIEITGTPQFDFHVREDRRWSRQKTCAALGVSSDEPFVIYCANTIRQTPREPELLLHVISEFKKQRGLRNLQWVVRLHPFDDYERWDGVLAEVPEVKLHRPWVHPVGTATYWGTLKDDDVSMLGNALRHSALALSIGSTIALDCAVVDAPIVNIGFHPDRGSVEDRYYFNAHRSHHYTPITESGAAPVAHNIAELINLATEAVESRSARSDRRRSLKELMCGPVDGYAADRIFTALSRRFLQ
ncbi:MAG TPA: hypothetical protein VKM94_22100 [Blastocatellia bacterium]|nr:hypothetical protein [Blastocatellia bacterium]